MKIVSIIFLLHLILFLPYSSSAQLSDEALDKLAQMQAEKWSQYLHLSSLRERKLKDMIKGHEFRKNEIVRSSALVTDLLIKEDMRFDKELGAILTPNELGMYNLYNQNDHQQSKKYFSSLMEAVNLDDGFVTAYNDLQYNEVLPTLVTFRQELEENITYQDKIKLDSIRAEVFNLYDNCLLYCLADNAMDTTLFENVNGLFLVDLNKSLVDPKSNLSTLLKLTHKYEEQIHEIEKTHSMQYDYWTKKTREIEDQYLLPNYVASLRKLKSQSPFASLTRLESEAIFLLLDPHDEQKSRKILSLGIHQLY